MRYVLYWSVGTLGYFAWKVWRDDRNGPFAAYLALSAVAQFVATLMLP